MLTTHKELLDDLTIRTTQYFDLLVELNDVTQEFVTELRSYLEYIDERILWLRSADPISGLTLHDAWAAVMDLGQTHHWQRIGLGLWNDAFDQPVMTLGFLIVFGALTVYRRPLRRRVAQLGEVAARGNCVQYLPTFRALLLTMVISGTWALALAYVGWRLIEVALTPGAQLILFWGTSLVGAALVYFPLECLRQVCRRKGLGECHFQWSTRNTHLLRMHLRWYVPLATLLVTLCYGMQVHRNDTWNTALGRIAFVALMLMTTTFLQRIVRPKGGLFQEYLAYHADGWFGRLKWIWYPALVLAPTATAFLAAVGYYYTAWQLSLRVFHTALVILVAVLGGALLYRRLFISRRKLAMRQARQRQQRMQEQAVAEETGRPAPPDISFDLAELNLQTRRLIHGSLVLAAITATWFIWSDMLPALAVLESVTLYRTESVAGVLQSVTLADMGVALIALIMTWTAARNLPGVIEIALLQRLPLESSVRYAITTLARYLIAIFGVIVVSSTLGFSWRRAQWLVAALGVGLGFGLQEIFGNFVSGLILLFERPIRVGDVITLGEVSGMVKRIRIRATTVRDWDGKELIVPNKDLITGRLLNWTLSDTENRIVITVGVGYGSDIHRAQEIMLEVADQHPELSKQPPPRVTFESFDPSSLRLVLRAFLPKLDTRTDCVNDLHTAIYDRFREEGIELAFPQIDVHVRDFAPLPVQDGQITVRDRSARSA